MKKFVTIFEKTENIHLVKDVGQIPYLMQKYFEFDSTIVTYKNNISYAYLENEVKGLDIEFIPKVKLGRYSLSILWYLFFNAKEIDILHLFHHREKTYLNFLMYKWRNPKGIAFLKSDIGLNTIKMHNYFFDKKRMRYLLRNWLLQKVLPALDIISFESKEGKEIMSKKFDTYKEKFIFISNGLNLKNMYDVVGLKKIEDKENIILTVGRIGAYEKNHELLLSAIESLNLKDYKMVFVGPIENKFQKKIDIFYKRNPQLIDKIIFTGAIYDRKKLFEWYAKSKIFCLTSREESFGFVLIEAMAYQNHIITTAISSANEITNFGQCGNIINSKEELIETLERCISNQAYLQKSIERNLERVEDFFDWKKILTKLHSKIEKLF